MPSNKETMINKLGSEAAYLSWLKENSSKGGSAKVSKGRNKKPSA